MGEPYRGAPTRIGRIMMAAFGAPFVVGAVGMLATTFFGDAPFRENLPYLLGSIVFASAGLMLWAPAFPGVVNRVLNSDLRLVKAVRPYAPQLAMGGLVIVMGLVPVLTAVGVIPTDDSFWEAPRWVGGIAGGLFVAAGLYIAVLPSIDRLGPRLRKQLMGLFPLVIVTGMAAISSWIAFGPGERAFQSGMANSIVGFTSGGGEIVGRAAFGIGALFLIVIAAVGWWKYLRGDW